MHHLPPFYSTFGAHNNHLQVDLSSDIDTVDTKDSIGVKHPIKTLPTIGRFVHRVQLQVSNRVFNSNK